MGSEKRVSFSDAYRIYTGHRFGRTILGTLFICTVLMMFISIISRAAMNNELQDLYTSYSLFSDVKIKLSYQIYCLFYILGINSAVLSILAWVTVFIKKLANTDICDKKAPGGKYLATVKGGRTTFAKAHIMVTAEPLISAFILFFVQCILLFLYVGMIWGETFSAYISSMKEDIASFVGIILIPSAVSNLCELIYYRINRIVLTAVLFPMTTFLSAVLAGGNSAALIAVSFVILIASEYMILKKKSCNTDDVPDRKNTGEGVV